MNQGASSYVYFYQCITSALPRPFDPSDRWIGTVGGRGTTDRRFVPAWGPPNPAILPLCQSEAVYRVVAGGPRVSATVKVVHHPGLT